METTNKIKNHFRENKKYYITGASCLAVGAVGGAAICWRSPQVSSKIVQILSYKPQATLEVFIEALGDPGNIIQDTTTGIIYASQGQAARELGLNPSELSKHLKGRNSHVKGHVFEKLGKAMVAE